MHIVRDFELSMVLAVVWQASYNKTCVCTYLHKKHHKATPRWCIGILLLKRRDKKHSRSCVTKKGVNEILR